MRKYQIGNITVYNYHEPTPKLVAALDPAFGKDRGCMAVAKVVERSNGSRFLRLLRFLFS